MKASDESAWLLLRKLVEDANPLFVFLADGAGIIAGIPGIATECDEISFTLRGPDRAEFRFMRSALVNVEYADPRSREWVSKLVLDEGFISSLLLDFGLGRIAFLIELNRPTR